MSTSPPDPLSLQREGVIDEYVKFDFLVNIMPLSLLGVGKGVR